MARMHDDWMEKERWLAARDYRPEPSDYEPEYEKEGDDDEPDR